MWFYANMFFLNVVFQHVLADVWVIKECELGNTDNQVHCRTHLGHLLSPGDIALG